MLLCPLVLKDRPSGDTVIGLIAAFGEQRNLADLSATLDILAHQVALTLESIMLRQEAIRQRNEAYFRALVQDASDAIVIVADDGTVKYATPSTAAIFGDVTVEGEYLWDLVAEEDRDDFARTFMRLRERARFGPRVVEREITRQDGSSVYIQARCSDLRAEPNVAGLVFTLRDVTAQHKLEEELKHRAFHDALTGLPNRLLFQDRIAQQVAAATRTGTIAGVLFVDLDDFKVVNDTKGHSVGDELLVAVAARLAALVRESDTAARLGGDEFALLIGGAESIAAVEAAAERIVGAFAEPFALGTGLVTTTVTVGVATTQDSTDTDELLRHADLALYAAKAAGKRQWRRYQPVLSSGLIRRREIQEALEEAVAKSAFSLVYQPIVALDTGELAGFEALIRWPHPQWGMMQPSQFITLAEETGQIIAIGSWVLRPGHGRHHAAPRGSAVRAGRAGRRPAPRRCRSRGAPPARRRDLYVSVNVSARQFADAGFADTVRQVLASSGLESQALMLELTETALLRRDERLHSDLAELKTIGVRLAIDDFGTGYSSLSYLRDLPIDVVKMDKSFVEGIAESDQRLAVAEGIVQIARTLSLEVIAEGIETEAQRDLLGSMGCHYGQGYLLAMPMPASQAEELARTGSRSPPAAPVPWPPGRLTWSRARRRSCTSSLTGKRHVITPTGSLRDPWITAALAAAAGAGSCRQNPTGARGGRRPSKEASMISRNRRGIRRASMRVRLAVAAAVLVGGGAAGVVAVAASHNGAVAAQSAGYTHHTLSETQALSSAMNGWNKSPSRSLTTLTQMTPMRTFNMTLVAHQHARPAARHRGRGGQGTRSSSSPRTACFELWYVNHGTKFLNVGRSRTGMAAMTGGTMAMPGHMNMNMRTKTLARGDLVFIFGERVTASSSPSWCCSSRREARPGRPRPPRPA